jgi:ferredoxin
MPHVVTDNCQDCLYTECVEVCPVQCFYISEADRMLFIHPGECIDCKLCVPECPVQAIYAEDDLPGDKRRWIKINADKTEPKTRPNISEKRAPLPGAEEKKKRLGL